MSISTAQLQSVMAGDRSSRVEALRQMLDYPAKKLDPQGSRFWFLRSGANAEEAEDTRPIAVGFYEELDRLSDSEILQFLTSEAQQKEIYGHYGDRVGSDKPVMYLLLPASTLR